MMRLSLSGRLIEVRYRYCETSVPEFLRFARMCGYDAVELRATQITADTTLEEVEGFRRVADELGIGVSCCMPPGITVDEEGLKGLEKFIPLAEMLRCDVLKVWVGEAGWLREACDLLEPHRMTLIVQTHTGGPFETVDSCLDAIARIGRDNFGLQYDPANLFVARQDYGEEAVKRLGGHIRQLSVQNVRPAEPDEPDVMEEDGFYYTRCLLGDPRGLDYGSVFKGLKEIGFEGYVVLNEPKSKLLPREEFSRRAAEELRKLLGKEASS